MAQPAPIRRTARREVAGRRSLQRIVERRIHVQRHGRTTDDLVLQHAGLARRLDARRRAVPVCQRRFPDGRSTDSAKFNGPFEELPGTLFTDRKELAGTTLNGSADMAVALTIPKVGSTELLHVSGTAALKDSTIAGMEIDTGQFTGSFADQVVDIKELGLTGPDVTASAAGILALGASRGIEARVRHRGHQSGAARETLRPSARGVCARGW